MQTVRDEHYYIDSKPIASFITKEAAMGRIVVPFRPPMSIDSRVTIIKPDDFNIKTLFGSFHKYTHKDFMTIQMKRIGFSGSSEFSEPILVIYGEMMTGLVTVAESGKQSTHIYTLNPKLAVYMCGKAAVGAVINETKEHPCDVKKNGISCLEIIPQRKNDVWTYDCQPAYYKCKKEQLVTYTLSILKLRNKIISQLLSGILDIQYFDIKTRTVRDITTSLSQSGLSNIMEAKVYQRIMKEMIDEKKMATLKLPVLHSDSEMAEIFIPAIMSYKYQTAGLLLGKKFDPFNKSK
ncbi:MAG: hypothetical protein K2J72_07535 [Oscillospiraceae bacterium]|nr:hypothetical protein [Oscillospiraceae bacterium]